MRTHLVLPIGLAALLLLGLCTALAGQAVATSDYTLATDDGLALSLSGGSQITSLQIDGTELVAAPGPALLLRDLSQAGAVTQPNLIGNPGFEQGMAGWTEASNTGLNVSVVVSPTHDGGYALELSNPLTATYGFAAYAGDPVLVTSGQRYRVSAWWRSATGYVTRPAGPPTLWQMRLGREIQRTNALYVQWLDASGRPLDDAQLAVPLHWNAGHWRLMRRELTAPPEAAQARVVIGARLSGETVWVDDVTFVASPETEVPATGTVTPCLPELAGTQRSSWELGGTRGNSAACLIQSIPLPEAGLSITVTYTAHADHIAVHGEVVDTAGQDRALDVMWSVPVTGESWTWWDDAHTSRPITDARTYANAISAIYDGWLSMSLYPYAGIALSPAPRPEGHPPPPLPTPSPVSGEGRGGGGEGEGGQGEGGEGLALGLPLDRPQLALLSYDGATGRYGATFHLGISPQAVKVGPRATFDLMLYRFNPAWGFRDVIARHRALQPDVYTTELPMYDYTDASQGQYYTSSGVQQALAEDAINTYSAQYTVGEFHLRLMPDTEPRPTLDQALAVLSDTLSSPQAHLAARAQAILNSAVVDTNGDWSIKKLGSFPWSQGMWEMLWAGNADPDLEDGLASYMLDWLIDPAFENTTAAGAHLDGVQIDNFMSNPTFDLRPQAIAAANWPLGYTPHTYQPAVHTGFAFREYLAFLRDYLDANWGTDRGITINFWGLGHPNYLAAYLDAFGSEGDLDGDGEGQNWKPEILNYRRAIAYPRVYRFANQTPGLTATEAYTFSQLALLYGVRPGHGPNGQGWEPEAEQIISDTVELVERFWAAGWEPVTYARVDSDDVWIERFGTLSPTPRPNGHPPPPLPSLGEGEGGGGEGLYFTIHNHTDLTRTATITVETAPLGLTDPATATITDLATDQSVPFSVVNGDIVVALALGAQETRVLQVSGGVASPTPTPTPTATPTPTRTPTATATPTPTATPSEFQCVRDANANGVGDAVDIMATAAELPCHIYLPMVVRNWRQPWPTPTPTSTPSASSALTVAADSDVGTLRHITGGHMPHVYELLNETHIPSSWRGNRQQYLDTLTALKDGVLAADPEARFAGPAIVGLHSTIIGPFAAARRNSRPYGQVRSQRYYEDILYEI